MKQDKYVTLEGDTAEVFHKGVQTASHWTRLSSDIYICETSTATIFYRRKGSTGLITLFDKVKK